MFRVEHPARSRPLALFLSDKGACSEQKSLTPPRAPRSRKTLCTPPRPAKPGGRTFRCAGKQRNIRRNVPPDVRACAQVGRRAKDTPDPAQILDTRRGVNEAAEAGGQAAGKRRAEGSGAASHLADYALRDGRAAAARMITWFGTLSDGRGLYLQTRTPREAPSAGSGEWDHKQALYPVPRPAHTQPKPLPNRPWSRRRGGCQGAQTIPHERHTGHHGLSGGPSAAPHPPDALGQPAPTLGGFTAASAPSAPPSPRATRAPGRTPERRPII